MLWTTDGLSRSKRIRVKTMKLKKNSLIKISQIVFVPIALLIVWSIFAPFYSLPGMSKICGAIIEMIENGTYFHDIAISSFRALSGFAIGFSLGAILGILTGRYSKVFLIFGGLLLFLRWTPVLAILPLTIRIGGLGEGPKIFIISWACFFLCWIYTHVAVTKLQKQYIWWSDSLGLSLNQRLFKVYLPAISPSLIGTARAALAISLIVVVAAELGGTLQSGLFRNGLGYRISRAIETNRNDLNIACILTFGLLGIIYDCCLFQAVKLLSFITKIDFCHSEG